MVSPSTPSVGLAVIHLFFGVGPLVDRDAVIAAIRSARAEGTQVVTAAMLGHKADVGIMALAEDQWRLRDLQSALVAAGLELRDSYVSLTEISEYAAGSPTRCARHGCTRSSPRRAGRASASTRCRSGGPWARTGIERTSIAARS